MCSGRVCSFAAHVAEDIPCAAKLQTLQTSCHSWTLREVGLHCPQPGDYTAKEALCLRWKSQRKPP